MNRYLGKHQSFAKHPAIAILVLLGFICIQLHSFTDTHTHAHPETLTLIESKKGSLTIHKKDESHAEGHADCIECVLTKQLQFNALTEPLLSIKSANGILLTIDTAFEGESHFLYISLRAPPIHTV